MSKQDKKRVAVLLSGGVDSSVAAFFLARDGYDAIGLTMKVWQDECIKTDRENCCGPRALTDVRKICHILKIPYYVLRCEKEFKKRVIDYFCQEYSNGRTPNPCVICNDKLKFETSLEKAREFGADTIATGHYARIHERVVCGKKRYVLAKGVDKKKDQSYFLFNLTQKQLRHVVFPLGELGKDEVRKVAKENGFPVHDKKDSTEICFIPDNDYKSFLKKQHVKVKKGNIVDTEGKVLGTHEGIQFYTIGQRRGIGIAAKNPYYVVRIDVEKNIVIVGDNDDLLRKDCVVNEVNWGAITSLDAKMNVTAKIRYNSPAVSAVIYPLAKKKVRVVFKTVQRAVAPGQAAVFYDGDDVVGGGWITHEKD
ncbi:MAG: tRNA 2-thiouridine(34) synthase MnmA [Candidatus Ancaeobacter aquaticus]|nr:tRNA 2-thiouridine(34) synthase MnmA [Candidatus Ancaeobacter aquaticus]